MSVSSSSNSSLHPPLDDRVCTWLFTAFFISSVVFLLPLLILILYVGYQRWRKQRSVATSPKFSHSDIFTINMVVLGIISVFGLCFHCYGTYTNQQRISTVGIYIFSISSPGETLLHLLTCVDRYLAVVHPVTYQGLRQAGGVRIRNISAGCVWLLSFGSPVLSQIGFVFNFSYISMILVFSFIVVSFCSISVLCVLIRPGPGEVGGNRERVDQSKQRAFHTMMAIMGALLLRFLSSLVSITIVASPVFSSRDYCLVTWSAGWFSLPSSLVLPLLFLHRAGKLPACKHNSVSA